MRRILKVVLLAAGLCQASASPAQYPTRPIRLIVLIAPGGAPDVAARLMAPKLGEYLGQPVVVENKAGSNGNIAAEFVAHSAPDGYTLLYGADSMAVINPHVYKKSSFDPLKELAPIATTMITQLVLSVNPKVPVKNFKEFLDYARAANPPLQYASGGNGSQHHLSTEMLKLRAGINLVHIPYKSGSPAAAAAVAGEVPIVMSGTSSGPLIKAGRLRAIAVTGRNRMALFPDVPTIGEFYPGYEVNNWLGMWAPAGTPDPVIARLRAEINRVLALPEVKERMGAVGGAEPWITTLEEFNAVIRRDYDKYGKLVNDIGAKID